MDIISIANQKGGVAKTTSAVNIAASLGARGKKVMLVDLDPQGNATMGVGVEKRDLEQSMLDVCLQTKNLSEIIIKTAYKNLWIAPSNQDLTVAEVEMSNIEDSSKVLKKAFSLVSAFAMFDVIVVDCPPSLNILTLNALVASDYLVVPIQCEYYALEGLSGLLDTVSDIQKSVNPDLDILGFLRTMFDGRARLSTEVSKQLESYLKDKVFSTIIPRNIRLAEAPSHGMPVTYYDRSSKGSVAYDNLSKEILKRLKN